MINIADQPEFIEGSELTVNWHKKKNVGEEAKVDDLDQYMDNANIAAILNEFNLLTNSEKTKDSTSASAAAVHQE